MCDELFKYGLLLSDFRFISAILVIGYMCVNKQKFIMAILLQVFSIVFNSYIKTLFKVPLNPEVFSKVGWAFPSGHTQSIANLLIYICWCYPKSYIIYSSAVTFFLAIISIEHFKYHNWIEISAGAGLAAFIVFMFVILYEFTRCNTKRIGAFLLVMTICTLMILISSSSLNYDILCFYTVAASVFYFSWLIMDSPSKIHFYQRDLQLQSKHPNHKQM